MRARVAVYVGGLFGTVLGSTVLAGPVAMADGLGINPASARPGDTVTVEGACGKGSDSMATITSPALTTQQADVGDRGWFSAEAMVRKVEPRRYTVTMSCNMSDKRGTGVITVKARHQPRSAFPHGGAMTGGGGAQDGGEVWRAAGTALLFGAAGVGGLALARARIRERI